MGLIDKAKDTFRVKCFMCRKKIPKNQIPKLVDVGMFGKTENACRSCWTALGSPGKKTNVIAHPPKPPKEKKDKRNDKKYDDPENYTWF